MKYALFLACLTGCIDINAPSRYELELTTSPCPTPAPIVNDDSQVPSTFPLGCPYRVRLPDGTTVTYTWTGKAGSDSLAH